MKVTKRVTVYILIFDLTKSYCSMVLFFILIATGQTLANKSIFFLPSSLKFWFFKQMQHEVKNVKAFGNKRFTNVRELIESPFGTAYMYD